MFSKQPRALVVGILWLAVGAIGLWVLDDAAAGSPRGVQITLRFGALACWAVAFGALAIASTMTLTIARLLVPVGIAAALLAAFDGVSVAGWGTLLVAAVATTGALFSAEVGAIFIQGSAYGAERRLSLRPPTWLVVTVPVLWLLAVLATVGGIVGLGESWWPAGVLLVLVGVAFSGLVGRACHQLSLRWLVLVPAGLVVHDPVVLADTLMLPRSVLHSIGPAFEGTTATDCTGGASGLVIEVTLLQAQPVAFAGRPGRPGSEPCVTSAVLVTPARPGRFLDLAAAHRLPVR